MTLTYTGDHLYTGSVSILAGRLVVRGNLPSSILIVQGGVHDLRGRPESYRGVRLISGSIIDSGRAVEGSETRVKGSLTVNADTRSGESYGEFDLRSGTVSATLAGSGALVKRTGVTTADRNPGGLVTLSGNNTYSGQTTVEAGVLRITHANALGTPATGETNTTVRSGATLQLSGGVSFSNREILTLSGQGVAADVFTYSSSPPLGALHSLSGNNTWNGAINLGAPAKINAQGAFVRQTRLQEGQVYTLRLTGQINNRGHNLTLSAFAGVFEVQFQSGAHRRAAATIEVSPAGAGPAITGAGGLIKAGGGPECATAGECATADTLQNSRVTLAGASDYTGQTTINAGELWLTHAEALPGALNLANQAGAQLVVAANATIGSLSGGAPSTASGNALDNGRIIILKGYTLTINQTTAGTYGSRIIEQDPDPVPNPAPGGANLVKTGAARLTLTGDSAYTGTTTVSGGALNIRQPNALGPTTGAAGRVTVNGGTLELQFNTGPRTFGKNLRLAGPGALSDPDDTASARLGALRSIRGTNTLSGRITLTGNATLYSATGADLTLAGIISHGAGSFGLLKRGAGVLTLTAANTYTGRTDIQQGELRLNHSGGNALHNTSAVNLSADNSSSNTAKLSVLTNETIGALSGGSATGGNVEISKGVTLTVNSVAGANTTYNGLIREVGASTITTRANLIKTGAGRLRLTRPNEYTGTTTVSGGVLAIASNQALGTGAGAAGGVTVNGGTLELATSGGAVSFSKLLTLHGSGHDNQGALRNATGVNTWASVITLGDAALIRNVNPATVDSLILSGGVSGTNRDLTVAGAGHTLISSALATGAGNLLKQSAGTLTLSGTNTYTGTTTVDGGTLAITGSGALGAGTVRVNSGGVLALSSDPDGTSLTLNRALTLNGGALGNVRGNNIYSGALTLTDDSVIRSTSGTLTVSGPLKLQTDAVSETAAIPHDLTVAGAGNVGLSGIISGAGGLNKTGGGTLTLSGANTYSGDTLVRGGTLALGASDRILNTGKLVIDGGTFSMGAFNETVGGVELKGNGNISGTGTLTLNNAGAGEANRRNFILESGTVGVILAGSAGLIKQGAADTLVTLARANTYTGETEINGGTLRINDPNGLGGTGASSGTTINSGGILESALVTSTQTIMINAGEALTLNGGVLRLRKQYTDTTNRTFGNSITLGADSAIEHRLVNPTSILGLCGGDVCDRTTTLSGNLVLQSASGGTTTGHTLTIRTRKTGQLFGNYISSVVLSGNISGAGGLIKEGAGDLRLTGTSNTYTGPTTIDGGSITLTRNDAISTASRLVINNGATLAMGAFNQTLRGLQLNDGNITVNNARLGGTTEAALGATARGVLTVTPARVAADPDGKGEFDVRKGTIAAILRGTNINLIKRSDGTATAADPDDIGGTVRLSFAGAHPLTGEVTIEAGRLIIDGTLSGGVLTVRGTYDLKGRDRNWTGVRLVSGRIIDSGREVADGSGGTRTEYGALTISGTFNLESGLVSARLSGTGAALSKNAATGENPDLVTLSNPGNDYTGLTTVNNGTLRITNSGALGAGRVVVSSGGTLELNPAEGSNLDLSQALTLAGGALASLRGNNIWRGNVGLTANNSTIRSAAGSTLDVRGPLSLQSGETPAARNLTIRGAGNVVLSGIISGLGGLIKGVDATDSGRLRLTGDNTFAGAVSVNHGVLRVAHNNALGTDPANAASTTTVAAGATLELAPASGDLTLAATETLSLAGDGVNTAAEGDPAVYLGALRNVSGNNTVNGAITLAGDVTIYSASGAANGLTLAGNIGHGTTAYGLSKTGAGKLTLSGANTYTGDTNINAGELELQGGAALADNAAVDLGTVPSARLTVTNSEIIGSLSGGGAAGGHIQIESGETLTVNQTADLEYNGRIGGLGNLKKTGTNTLTLTGANDYEGTTEVDAGTLAISRSSGLGTADGGTTVNAGATLKLDGDNLSVAEDLNLSGTLANAGDGNIWSGALTLTGTGTLDSGAGETLTVSGAIGGAGGLNKTGVGVVALMGTGVNTYAGATNVNAGILRVGKSSALGTPAAPTGGTTPITNTTVAAGATLELAPAAGISGLTLAATESLSLAGDGVNTAAAGDPAVYLGALRNVSGSNTVSGTITLAADATIHNAAPGGNSLTLAGISGAHNLTVTGAGNTTINGIIAIGAGRLSKAGTGRLTLTGVNSYTGDTHINDGELELDNADGNNVIAQSANVILASTGSPKLSIASNQTIRSLRGGGEVAIAASQRLTVDQAGNTTYNGLIRGTGAGGLTKDGTGTLTLGGANTYGGTTLVNAGALVITHSNALGLATAGNGTSVASGATLRLSGNNLAVADALSLSGTLANTGGNNEYSGALTLAGTGALDSASGRTLTVSGAIGGAGRLSKTGAGVVALSGTGDNTYAGATNVAAGILRIRKSSALGAATTAGNTTVAAGATLELDSASGNLTIAENLELTGQGVNTAADGAPPVYLGALRNVSGDNTVNGTITLAGDTTIYSAGGRNNSLTLAGVISHGATAYGLRKIGAGKLTLTGANSYEGDTDIDAGELELNNSDSAALHDSSAVKLANVAGAQLTVTNSETIGALSGGGAAGGNIAIASGERLTINQAGNTSYSGLIRGATAAGLSKDGTGTLTLGGANTYGGTTLVNAGALVITHSSALGLATDGNGTSVASGATLRLSGNNLAVADALSLSGTLANTGGNNEYSGALTLTGTGALDSASGRTLTVSGAIGGAGGLNKTGAGTLALMGTGDNTYAGATNINAGILRIGKSSALGTPTSGANGGTTVAAGATLALAGGSSGLTLAATESLELTGQGVNTAAEGAPAVYLGALRNVSGDNTINGTITLAGTTTIYSAGGTGNSLTLAGVISHGATAYGLRKIGAGKLTLKGANSYEGDTHIDAGELELDNTDGNNVIAQSANVILATTGSPKLSIASNQTIRSLRGGGEVAIADSQRLTLNQAGDTSYNGVISGAGAAGLTKDGTGTLTLTGANTYGGTTLVDAGALIITHSSALGLATAGNGTTVASGATLRLSGNNLAVADALSLGGTLASQGGNNEYSGTMTLTGAGPVTLNSATANNTLTVSGAASLGNQRLNITGAGHTALTGAISGGNQTAGGIVKDGAGRLTLEGDNNSYIGAIRLADNGGTLRVRHSNALGRATLAGPVTIGAGATLELDGGAGNLAVQKRVFLANNSTLRNLSGANTLRPRLTITRGAASSPISVTIDNRQAPASTTDASASLTLSGVNRNATDFSVALSFTGPGNTFTGPINTGADSSLSKAGTGRLTLNGTSSYTGLTDIRQGTLIIGEDNAINAGSRLIVGQLQSGASAAVPGVFAMGEHNQTFSGVRLNAGSITASPSAPSTDDTPPTRGILTVTPARQTGEPDGKGEFDLRSGTIQAILAGADVNVMKRSDGTTAADQTPTGAAADIGGTVRLSYTGSHLYTGETRILAGRLLFSGSASGSILVVENNTTHDLKGREESYRGVRLIRGSIVDTGDPENSTSTGSLTVNSGGGVLSAGEFDLRSGTVSAKLAGSGDLVKNAATGAGVPNRVILSGNNTYSGQTRINSGILRITSNTALGTAPMVGGVTPTTNTTVNSGGTLQLAVSGSLNIPATESLTLDGGLLHSLSGANTWAGNIDLDDDSRILAQSAESAAGATTAPAATTLRLSGAIDKDGHRLTLEATGAGTTGDGTETRRRAASSITVQRAGTDTNAIAITGAGGLRKAGSGLVTLASRNDYTGLTDIMGGELKLDIARAIQGAAVRLANTSGARLTVTQDTTIGALSGGGANGGNIEITKGRILTVNSATGADTTYSGVISETGASTNTARVSLVKTGAGKLTLGGSNSYTGTTTVSNGILAISHSNALGTGTGANARVTVNTGGTLELEGPTSGTGLSLGKLLTLNGPGFNSGTTESPLYQGALHNALGNNTWSGAITLAGNTTIVQAILGNTLTLSGGVGLATDVTGATLTLAGNGNTAITNAIATGTGGLSKTGGGTLTLSATNTYTGVTRVEGGTLKLGQDAAIDDDSRLVVAGGTFDLAGYDNTFDGVQLLSGTISDSGRTVLNLDTPESVTGKLTLNNASTSSLRYFDLREGTVSARLAGTAGLRKTGAGKVTLASANSYTGATFIDAGTLAIGDNHALGFDDSDEAASTTTTTVATGATLELDPGAGETLTINNENLTLNGQGVLDGDVRQGALRNVSGTNTWSGAIRVASNATTIHNANTTGTAPTLILSGTLTLESATDPAVAANLTLTGAGKTRITGQITGLGGLIKQGGGTLVVNNSSSTNPNNYQGGTEIREGELELQGGEASPDHGAAGQGVTLSRGATLRVSNNETIGSLKDAAESNPGGNVVIVKGQTLTVANATDTTYSGVISEANPAGETSTLSANLTKTGAGVFTLAGQSTYTGRTRVQGGTLALGRDQAISRGNQLFVENGATFALGRFNNTFANNTGRTGILNSALVSLSDGNITRNPEAGENQGVLTVNGGPLLGVGFALRKGAVSAILAGNTGLTKLNPLDRTVTTVVLSGANRYTGRTDVSEGTLALGANDVIPDGSTVDIGTDDASPVAAIFDLRGFNDTVAGVVLRSGNINGTGTLTVNSTGKFDLRRGTVRAALAGTADLEKNQVSATIAGPVTLSGTNTYEGETNINAGNLTVTGNNALPDNSAVTLNNDATNNSAKLIIQASETIGTLAGGHNTGGGHIDITKGQTLTINQTAPGVYNGVIREIGDSTTDRASLIKQGAGKLTLGGTNLYTGLTTVREGILAVTNDDALGTADMGTLVNTGAALELSNNVTVVSEALTLSGAGVSATPGALRNATGDNTWNGAITLAGDTTFASDSGRLTVGSALTLTHSDEAADLTITGAGDTTLNGRITGLGGLIKQGAGTLVVSNSNSANPNDYLGGTEIREGELELQGGEASPDDGAAGRGVTLSTDATLRVSNSETIGSLRDNSADTTPGGNVVLGGFVVLTVNNDTDNPTTFSGEISDGGGFGRLTKDGEGVFTLAGENTYTGLTTVKGGTLALGRDNAIAGSNVLRIESGGIFDLRAFSNAFTRGVQLASGEIRATGADSNRDSNQGKLFVNNPIGAFSLFSGTIEAKLAGTAKLSKVTTGTVRLRGLNSYTGITEISKGTLALEGSDDVLPTNTRLEVGTVRVSGPDATDATLDLGTTNATVGHVLLRGGNIVRAAGATANQGVLTVNPAAGDKIDLRRGTVSAILAGDANLEKDSVTITWRVLPAPAVTETRQGVVTLSGPNRYTGTTTINAGELVLTGGAALPDNSAVALATATSAKLTIQNTETIGSLSGGSATGGGIDITKGQTLTVNQTTDGVYNGVISEVGDTGRANFTKTGAARLTLGGLNLYTGLTTINAGTLAIANTGALGSGTGSLGTVVNTGGVLELAGGGLNIEDEELALNDGTLRNAAGEGDADNTWGGAITLAGSGGRIDGTGGLTLDGAIDGTTVGQQDLTIAGSLTASFNSAIGGRVALRDFIVEGAAQIILNANLTATRRVTFSNITAAEAVNQTAGVLRAPELLLQNNAGSVNLVSEGNDITTLAGANLNGQLNYIDRNGFTIGTVGDVSGITTNNAGVSLAAGLAEAGALNIGADIRAGSGEVRLASQNGDINGAGGVVATSSRLTVTASGGIGVNGAFRTEFTGTEAGSLNISTSGAGAAGNINLIDPGLNTRVLALNTDDATAQTIRLRRHSGESRNPGQTTSGESRTPILVNNTTAGASALDANDTLIFDGPAQLDSDINTNNPAFTFNGPVTTNANLPTAGRPRINTGRGALTFRSTINAGANTLALTSNRLTLFDDITAGALDMSGATELVISGNSPTLNVNPVNIRFPNTMTGRGALTIPGMRGQDLDVGAGLRLAANMRGYRGHLIIGGRITPEGMTPYYGRSVSNIRVNVPNLTISRPIETGGPLTLLAGDIRLTANIRTGGQLGILAAGPNVPGLSGSRGVIDASAGPVRLSVPADRVDPARPSAALVAVGGFASSSNINLSLARRELDVASGQGAASFDPGSRFTDRVTDPAFRDFVARLGMTLGASGPLGLQFAQAFSSNPAAGLVAAETLAFVDLSLLGEELTLFGMIGAGIALSLSQCEEQYGCAPNITLAELDTLIEQLEARVNELERRWVEADDAGQAVVYQQLFDYWRELKTFEDYREELKRYILTEEDPGEDSLEALPEATGDSDEVARLTRVLQSVRARVRWLEGLKTDPAERERLGQTTGAELTLDRLEAIIEATRAQAGSIENRIRLLLEGARAMLPAEPDFKAEAGDYEAMDVVQYGDPSFDLGALTGERGLY